MSKKNIFLITLIFFSVLVFSYIIITSEKIDSNYAFKEDKLNTNSSVLTENYKKEIILILDKFNYLDENNSLTKENILNLKSSLLEMIVPKNYKKIHLNTIIAFEKMENFLESNNEEDRISSKSLINDAKIKIEE